MTSAASHPSKAHRWKFIIGGILFVAAVIIMVVSASQATAEFFMTVAELEGSNQNLEGQNLRVSGAVLGETISYDSGSGLLTFTIAHIPGEEKAIEALGGLETALNQAVNNPDNPRLNVRYAGPPPDMLRHEAQAILTGTLDANGVFMAEELLLKCPSRYEEALPEQVE